LADEGLDLLWPLGKILMRDFMKKIRQLFPAAIILCLTILPIKAQTGEEPWGKTISSVAFSGLRNIKESDIRGLVSSYQNKSLTPEVVGEIEGRLRNTGYFYTVDPQVAPDSLTATHVGLLIVVTERSFIDNITFTGNKKLKVNDLISKSNLRKREVFNVTNLQTASANIETAYHEAGYLEAKISYDYTEHENGLVDIHFTISEGMPEVVKEIRFEGTAKLGGSNPTAAQKQLLRIIQQKTQGFIFQKGLFNRSFIREDMERITLFYRTNGFLDAAVSEPEIIRQINEADGIIEITLVYNISEGDQWTYGGIIISGNEVFTDEELYPIFNISPENPSEPVSLADVPGLNIGEIIDYTKLRQALLSLQSLYSNQGYIFNTYDFDENGIRDSSAHMVTYAVRINEFDRAHVENITISGNDKTKDHVITREIPFEAGEVFSQGKLISAYNNLMATGYFNTVTPALDYGSEIGLVNINIDLEEGRTTELQFGITVGGTTDGFPVSGLISVKDSNFLGYGYDVSLSLKANQTDQEVSASFYNPRFLNSRFGVGFNIRYSHSTESVTQDILGPIFDDTDVPDPYRNQYVFTKETTINGTTYKAGEYWDYAGGAPSDDDIKKYGLVKDYQYFLSDNDQYGMNYDYHEIGFGVSGGYVLPMPGILPGYLRLGNGFDVSWAYVSYDPDIYRPAYASLRNALHRWTFNDGYWIKVSWDALNNPRVPTKGFILSQYFYLAGGYLGGYRTYAKSQSRFDYYYQFPAISFSDDEDAWKMQWGLRLRTAWNWIGNQFNKEMVNAIDSYYTLDGMFFGRGWGDISPTGRIFWDNSLEFRLPIFSQFLWWDTFLDMHMLWYNGEQLRSFSTWYNNFYGAIGTGFRVAIPSFPISFYLIKRFRFKEGGGIDWNPGRAPTFAGAGLDLAITFSVDMY
jgi:outer membrane protein insertion porin family